MAGLHLKWFHIAALLLLVMGPLPLTAAAAEPEAVYQVANTKDAGPGSLRQAILDANARGGKDHIRFNITRGSGVRRIRLKSALPDITGPVILDGYTQPGARANTQANGNNAVLLIELDGTVAGVNVHGLVLAGGNSTVRGLIINGFDGNGIWIRNKGGNSIEGNWIGVDSSGMAVKPNRWSGIEVDTGNNTIGGTSPAARNVISGNLDDGIDLFNPGPSGNSVLGNYIGPAKNGKTPLPNPAFGADAMGNAGGGIYIQGPNNQIGGTSAGAGNVLSANGGRFSGAFDSGVMMEGAGASANRVQGNYIGVTKSGSGALGNFQVGVMIVDASSNTVGGSANGAGNVISANLQDGVQIFNTVVISASAPELTSDPHQRRSLAYISSREVREPKANRGGRTIARPESGSTGNVIQGNFIGTGAQGKKKFGNAFDGVFIFQGASNNLIGGTQSGQGNRIANNKDTGVDIRDAGSMGNAVLGNRIFKNAFLGIDLAYDDATANDAGDTDVGPNLLQNYPVLNPVSKAANRIKGTLNSTANTTFRLEFFRINKCDAVGNGEAKVLLGAKSVTTNGVGNASFNFKPDGALREGNYVTATATDPNNNTSEFSACALIGP